MVAGPAHVPIWRSITSTRVVDFISRIEIVMYGKSLLTPTEMSQANNDLGVKVLNRDTQK